MYRDNSLMPKEAVRLAALGMLVQNGSKHYADVAYDVRHFTGRIVGPSLDLMGSSLELLCYEGLIEAIDRTGMEDNALLGITAAGRKEFDTLMRANVRAPSSDDLNKLVITLKLRFLHLLDVESQREQADALAALYETELARLQDLRRHHDGEAGYITEWLDHDIAQVSARLQWFQELHARV
jgi:hypothetical protein